MEPPDSPPWPTWKCVGSRLLLVYFVIFAFPFPVTWVPGVGAWLDAARGQVWLAVIESTVLPADLAMLLTMLVPALVISLTWSIVDRKSSGYPRAARWLEVGCRFYLGAVMIGYGLIKVFALQMLKPQLQQLVAPLGDLTRMGLVWTFMGISPVYQSFTGAAEVIGGLLLFWRRTRLLGATIVAVVMTNVVLLNFLYDIPVKLNSSHYLLMAIALMLLDARRLLAVFVSNQPAPTADLSPMFATRRARIAAEVGRYGFLGLVFLSEITMVVEVNRSYGHRKKRHALWGIHDVESFVRDGQEAPPLLTDELRWKALILDDALAWGFSIGYDYLHVGEVYVQRMDGALERYEVRFDDDAQTMTLSRDAKDVGVLKYEQSESGELSLRGEWSGSQVEIRLRERDVEAITLMRRDR